MAELVDALARRYGDDRRTLVRYEPGAALDAVIGRYPPLLTPAAQAVGFRNDATVDTLQERALCA